jgi:hypothetical protein
MHEKSGNFCIFRLIARHFLSKMHEERGTVSFISEQNAQKKRQFPHFLLKIAEKRGKLTCDILSSIILSCGSAAVSLNMSRQNSPDRVRQPK